MQIAVTAAHEASAAAFFKQVAGAQRRLVRGLRKLLDLRGRHMIAVPQARAVAVDQGGDGGNPGLTVGGRRRRMRSRDRVGDGRRKVRIELSGLRQMIQRPALVET